MPNQNLGEDSLKLFNIDWDNLLFRYRIPLIFLLVAVILISGGIYFFNNGGSTDNKIEVIETSLTTDNSKIKIEIVGAVENPGVYEFNNGERIGDAIVAGGGLSVDADREWVEKYINRAAKLTDGQKIYILKMGENQTSFEQSNVLSAKNDGGYQTASGVKSDKAATLVNINQATLSELDSLPGIGQVYGQKIIEQRPYSNTEELLSKGVIPNSTFEKIKDLITTY